MAYVESRNRATSDPGTRKEVLAEIESRGIEDVLLWFTDLEGHLKSFAITRNELEGALDDGMGFDGSSITGFNAIEESDMIALPDPATFRTLPWRPVATPSPPRSDGCRGRRWPSAATRTAYSAITSRRCRTRRPWPSSTSSSIASGPRALRRGCWAGPSCVRSSAKAISRQT